MDCIAIHVYSIGSDQQVGGGEGGVGLCFAGPTVVGPWVGRSNHISLFDTMHPVLVALGVIYAMPQSGNTSDGLMPPLASVTWCLGAASSAEDCGPAIQGRTDWNNDWCGREARLRSGELELSDALRGAVIDIVLVPDEDETLWSGNSFGGLVGDVLNDLASRGGFTWNAIVVRPPHSSDVYGGSWNLWMRDWVNRADLIAAWMYDSGDRRDQGISFPYSFYELSPVLVVADLGLIEQQWWQGDLMAFLQPFSKDLCARPSLDPVYILCTYSTAWSHLGHAATALPLASTDSHRLITDARLH